MTLVAISFVSTHCTDFAVTPRSCEPGLFLSVPEPGSTTFELPDETVLRSRFVRVDFALLTGFLEHRRHLGERLDLDLFDDVCLPAIVEEVSSPSQGGVTAIGRVVGHPTSQVVLVVRESDEVLVGSITIESAFYAVRYVERDVHVILEVDQNAFPPEKSSLRPERDAPTNFVDGK